MLILHDLNDAPVKNNFAFLFLIASLFFSLFIYLFISIHFSGLQTMPDGLGCALVSMSIGRLAVVRLAKRSV